MANEDKKIEETKEVIKEEETKEKEAKTPDEKEEKKPETVETPSTPPKPVVHKINYEKDIVYLYQFSRTPVIPSISPYCLKVETWLRLAGIKYEVRIFGIDVCHIRGWSRHIAGTRCCCNPQAGFWFCE